MGKRVDLVLVLLLHQMLILGIRELGVPKKIAMNITFPLCVNERNKDSLQNLY